MIGRAQVVVLTAVATTVLLLQQNQQRNQLLLWRLQHQHLRKLPLPVTLQLQQEAGMPQQQLARTAMQTRRAEW